MSPVEVCNSRTEAAGLRMAKKASIASLSSVSRYSFRIKRNGEYWMDSYTASCRLLTKMITESGEMLRMTFANSRPEFPGIFMSRKQRSALYPMSSKKASLLVQIWISISSARDSVYFLRSFSIWLQKNISSSHITILYIKTSGKWFCISVWELLYSI